MKKCWIWGKRVIVTGASSGIGGSLARKLVKEYGCTVIGIARNRERLEALKRELGENFAYESFDVSEIENWKIFAESFEEKAAPDIIINNAGMLPPFDKFENYTWEEMERTLRTNFFSCMYSVKSLMPYILKSESPAIVNISSSAALLTLGGTSLYSASKAAVKSFTEALRTEKKGMYVGLVCPGFTKTDIFREQSCACEGKIFDAVCTPCERMTDKILRGIIKKRSKMVLGKDAKIMNMFGRICPGLASKAAYKVMKASGLELFEKI